MERGALTATSHIGRTYNIQTDILTYYERMMIASRLFYDFQKGQPGKNFKGELRIKTENSYF